MKGKHIPKSELKVGMTLICGDDDHTASSCWKINGERVAFELLEIGNGYKRKAITTGHIKISCSCGDLDHLYLWDDPSTSTPTLNNSLTKVMNNVVTFFKNLSLTSEDKLLLAEGIELPTGTPTPEGLALSAEITYRANRAVIIAIVKQMKAEQEAK